MRIQQETITPRRAQRILQTSNETGRPNRPISPTMVKRIAKALTEGRVLPTGDPIRICDDGWLADGQHRLNAIVMSGVPMAVIVEHEANIDGDTRYEPEDFARHLDKGRKRSPADNASMMNISSPKIVTSGARLLTLYEAEETRDKAWVQQISMVDEDDLFACIDRHENIEKVAAEYPRALQRQVNIPDSVACAAMVLFDEADRSGRSVTAFFEGLVTGSNLERGDGRLILRNYLLRRKQEHVPWGSALVEKQVLLAIVILAWNAFVKDEEMSRISRRTWKAGNTMPKVLKAR